MMRFNIFGLQFSAKKILFAALLMVPSNAFSMLRLARTAAIASQRAMVPVRSFSTFASKRLRIEDEIKEVEREQKALHKLGTELIDQYIYWMRESYDFNYMAAHALIPTSVGAMGGMVLGDVFHRTILSLITTPIACGAVGIFVLNVCAIPVGVSVFAGAGTMGLLEADMCDKRMDVLTARHKDLLQQLQTHNKSCAELVPYKNPVKYYS